MHTIKITEKALGLIFAIPFKEILGFLELEDVLEANGFTITIEITSGLDDSLKHQ